MQRSSLVLFVLVCLACGGSPSADPKVEVEPLEPTRADEAPMEDMGWAATLHEVEVLGTLPGIKEAPYVVLRARGCTECDANLSLYVHRPSDGPVGTEDAQVRYAYPGILLDPMEGDTILRTRTFLGEVQPGTQGLLWRIEERTEDGTWSDAVLQLTVVADTLQWTDGTWDPVSTAARLQSGQLRELPGLTQVAEP